MTMLVSFLTSLLCFMNTSGCVNATLSDPFIQTEVQKEIQITFQMPPQWRVREGNSASAVLRSEIPEDFPEIDMPFTSIKPWPTGEGDDVAAKKFAMDFLQQAQEDKDHPPIYTEVVLSGRNVQVVEQLTESAIGNDYAWGTHLFFSKDGTIFEVLSTGAFGEYKDDLSVLISTIKWK